MTSNQFFNSMMGTPGLPSDVFPTIGKRGMVVNTSFHNSPTNLGGAGRAYRVVIEWASDSAFANIVAMRQFVVAPGAAQGGLTSPANGRATLGTPHFGDFVRFTFFGGGFTGTNGVNVVAEHRDVALSYWGNPNTSGLVAGDTFANTSLLIPFAGAALAAGASVTLEAEWPYEGPVFLTVHPNYNPTAAESFRVTINAVDENGATTAIFLQSWATATPSPDMIAQLQIPPALVRVVLTNQGTIAHTLSAALTADYSRMAA